MSDKHPSPPSDPHTPPPGEGSPARKSSLRRTSQPSAATGEYQPPPRLVSIVDGPPAIVGHRTDNDNDDVVSDRSVDLSPSSRRRDRSIVSFNNTPVAREVDATTPPTEAPYTPASRARHLVAIQNNIRAGRRTFFNAIGPSKSMFSLVEARNCPIKCTGLASMAAGLSYLHFFAQHMAAAEAHIESEVKRLTAQDLDIQTALPVTVDSIMAACSLPFAFLNMNDLTVQHAHDIISAYCTKHDEHATVTTELVSMDLRVTEVMSGPHQDFDGAPRELPLDAPQFRGRLLDLQKDHTNLVIVFYDKNLIDDSVIPEDEDDLNGSGGDLTMNKSFMAAVMSPPSNAEDLDLSTSLITQRTVQHQTEAAVVVGVARSDRVQLGIPRFTDNRSGMVVLEVPLATLHRAMAAAHPFSCRANGFIVLHRKSHDATSPIQLPVQMIKLNDRLAVTDGPPPAAAAAGASSDQPIMSREITRTPRVSPRATSVYGYVHTTPTLKSGAHVQPHLAGFAVGSHMIAMAMARELLHKNTDSGLDINAIYATLKLPFEQALNADVALEGVGAMCKAVFPAEDFNVSILPMVQSLRRATASCTVSTVDFATALTTLKHHNSVSAGNAVMLVQFNTAYIHWLVESNTNATAGSTHWCIVGNYRPLDETVDIIETRPSKYGSSWQVDIDRLHRAMANHGFIVVSKKNVPPDAFLPSEEDRSSLIDIAMQTKPYVAPRTDLFSSIGPNIHPGAPLSLAAAVMQQRDFDFSKALQLANLPFCFLLDPRITLYDYAWCCRDMLAAAGATDARVTTSTFVFSVMGDTESDMRSRFDDMIDDAVASRGTVAIVFNFLMEGLSVASRLAKGPVHPIGFALLTGVRGDMLHVLDTSANPADARWAVSRQEMFEAVARNCPITRRPLGAVYIALENAATPKSGQPHVATRSFLPEQSDRSRITSLLPLQPHLLPSIEGAALALGALGIRTTAENLLYRAGRHATAGNFARHPTQIAMLGNPTSATHAIVERYLAVTPSGEDITVAALDQAGCRAHMLALATEKNTDDVVLQTVIIYNAGMMHGQSSLYSISAGLVAASQTYGDGSVSLKFFDALPSAFGDSWSAPVDDISCAALGAIVLRRTQHQQKQPAAAAA